MWMMHRVHYSSVSSEKVKVDIVMLDKAPQFTDLSLCWIPFSSDADVALRLYGERFKDERIFMIMPTHITAWYGAKDDTQGPPA